MASANNKRRSPASAVGCFFSPEDRVERMSELVEKLTPLDVEAVKALPRDVYVASSAPVNRLLVDKLRESQIGEQASGPARRVYDLMAQWDGQYATIRSLR